MSKKIKITEPEYTYFNNFRLVNNRPVKEKPPQLEKPILIDGCSVYFSTLNSKLCVIYDDENDLYYCLEENGESENVEGDIKKNIELYITKNSSK